METLAVSVGYLIYDLVCCQFEKHVKLDNTVHHLVSITGLVAGLSYQRVITNWQLQLMKQLLDLIYMLWGIKFINLIY